MVKPTIALMVGFFVVCEGTVVPVRGCADAYGADRLRSKKAKRRDTGGLFAVAV